MQLTDSTLLSPEQIHLFHDQGYLVVDDLIPHADLEPVIQEINYEVDWRAKKLAAKGELSRSFEECGFVTRLAKIIQETDKIALSIWSGILHGPAIFHLIAHPRLLDIAEQFCGPELIASSVYRLRPKIPNYGYGAVPWHQDSGYMDPYCDNNLVLTVWIPLVDATEENGCMWVIPRSHRQPVLKHKLAATGNYLEIEEQDLPEEDRVCCPVGKGGVMLLTNRTVHGSFENRTPIVRWSMDLRYQNASLPTNAPITRLPGEIVPSVEQNVPAACYPPEADFLVRSRLRPQEVTRTYEQFREIRERPTHGSDPNRFGVKWAPPKNSEI